MDILIFYIIILFDIYIIFIIKLICLIFSKLDILYIFISLKRIIFKYLIFIKI